VTSPRDRVSHLDLMALWTDITVVECDAADRRNEEDTLSATVYSNLPYPENQLVSLAHSLVARGVIDETELQERLASIRARLEAG
jgi:hypothetical protein